MLRVLRKSTQTMYDEGINSELDYGKQAVDVIGFEAKIPDKRRRKVKIWSSEMANDDGHA